MLAMVKLRSPLFSFSASGSFADQITFLDIGGVPYAKTKQKKPVSRSKGQDTLRSLFKEASVLAKDLTDDEKLYYASLDPDSAACPWWNNFIGCYINKAL
ncbi:unnamed protein product, partial [marine sediment metagenome]